MAATGRRIAATVIACTVALSAAASACGGADKKPATTPPPGSGSPLDALFGTPEEVKDRERRIEAKIATCMQAKGWQYTPADVDKAFGATTDPNADDDTYRATFGYGVSTGPNPLDPNATADPSVDPNATYINGLPEADQRRYFNDLDSRDGTAAPTATSAAPSKDTKGKTPTRSGCRPEAEQAVGGNPIDDPKYVAVFDIISDGLATDPRLAEANKNWSDCMAVAGFAYASSDDIVQELQDRLVTLQDETPGPDETKLRQLQTDELALAKADGVCDKQFVASIRRDVEQDIYKRIIKQFPELAKKGS
jgi:hypothetical protein